MADPVTVLPIKLIPETVASLQATTSAGFMKLAVGLTVISKV